MTTPDYQTIMRPLLAAHGDGQPCSQAELRSRLADEFSLTPENLEERLPSGTAKTFNNRVGWATTYLVRAELLSRPRRAVTVITERGREILRSNPDRIDNSTLDQFEEFREFRLGAGSGPSPDPGSDTMSAPGPEATPQERMEAADRELRSSLAEDLVARLLDHDDRFFERVVLDVLVEIGYGGGSRSEAAERVGGSSDGGIDGIIREDRLGLDVIYVQAKRWQNPVPPATVREFIGALEDAGARKGVFITTSRFTREAQELADRRRIVTIDGRRLAQFMIEAGVGVEPLRTYQLGQINEDYFSEEGDDDSS